MNKDLILTEKTIREFDYDPLKLTKGSSRYIWHRCEICNQPKLTRFNKFMEGISTHFPKCSNIKKRQTFLQRHHVEHNSQMQQVKDSKIQTCLKKHGVDHHSKIKDVQQKRKQTNIEKYEVDNPMKSQQVKEKYKQTCLRIYGVNNPSKSKNIKQKKKQTYLQNFGVSHPLKLKKFKDKVKQTRLQQAGYQYNTTHRPYSKDYWLKQDFNGCKINPDQDLPDLWSQGCNSKFEIICSCGKIFSPFFYNLVLNDIKSCGHYSQSEGEKELGEYLELLFPGQVTSQDNLEFLKKQGVGEGDLKVDYAIRDLRLAFEYDGQHHFQPVQYGGMSVKKAKKAFKKQQQNDKNKEQLLKQNSWTLIRIKYDQDIKHQLVCNLQI